MEVHQGHGSQRLYFHVGLLGGATGSLSVPLQTKSPIKRRGFKSLEKAQNYLLNHLGLINLSFDHEVE